MSEILLQNHINPYYARRRHHPLSSGCRLAVKMRGPPTASLADISYNGASAANTISFQLLTGLRCISCGRQWQLCSCDVILTRGSDMSDYQLTASEEPCAVIRTADGACIPPDPANRDYAEYQKWVEAGGVPDPYVPPEPVPPHQRRAGNTLRSRKSRSLA